MPGEIARVERTYSLQNGSELLFWGFSETDADDFNKLLPADVISKVAYSLDQLFSRVHVESFQPHFKSLSINADIFDSIDVFD